MWNQNECSHYSCYHLWAGRWHSSGPCGTKQRIRSIKVSNKSGRKTSERRTNLTREREREGCCHNGTTVGVSYLWIRNVKAEDYIGEQVETEKLPKIAAEAASRLLKLQNLRELKTSENQRKLKKNSGYPGGKWWITAPKFPRREA